jgi:hypothetical protein
MPRIARDAKYRDRTRRASGPATDPRSARRGFALRPTFASRPLRSRGTAFASHTSGAGGTSRTLRTGFGLRTSRTALASRPALTGWALRADRAGRPLRTGEANCTGRALRTGRTSDASRAGRALRTNRTNRASRASRPDRTSRALRTGRPRGANRPGRPLRTCWSLGTRAAHAAHDDTGEQGCHKSHDDGPPKGVGGHPLLELIHVSPGGSRQGIETRRRADRQARNARGRQLPPEARCTWRIHKPPRGAPRLVSRGSWRSPAPAMIRSAVAGARVSRRSNKCCTIPSRPSCSARPGGCAPAPRPCGPSS